MGGGLVKTHQCHEIFIFFYIFFYAHEGARPGGRLVRLSASLSKPLRLDFTSSWGIMSSWWGWGGGGWDCRESTGLGQRISTTAFKKNKKRSASCSQIALFAPSTISTSSDDRPPHTHTPPKKTSSSGCCRHQRRPRMPFNPSRILFLYS